MKGIDAPPCLLYESRMGIDMKRSSALFVLVVTAGLLSAGCKPSLLPGTTVEDTTENRRVVGFVAKYQEAIQQRSADGVIALCAADYFEDNGTVDQTDDYGADKLKAILEEHFAKTKEIQLEILVQKVEENDDIVFVDYRYKQRALVVLPAGQQWITSSDVNRLVLREDEDAGDSIGRYQIVSGL